MLCKGNTALPPKYKIIFSKSVDTDIPRIPSERIIAVQNDIARDEHVNFDELSTNYSIDSLVKSEVNTDLSCDEHVNSDDDIIDQSYDSLAKADAEVAAINGECTCSECLKIDHEDTEMPCDDHVNDHDITTEITCESHVDTDYESATTSVEQLPAFIRVPPNKLEVCEMDCGKTGLIVDPEYWHWLDLPHSSEENLTSDDGGTASIGRKSGDSYGMSSGDASRAASHSCSHSSVPAEKMSDFNCGGYPVNSDGAYHFNHTPSRNSIYDELFESDLEYGDINSGYHQGSGNFYPTPPPSSSVHSERQEWILDCSDLDDYNHAGCASSVNGGDNSLDDRDAVWEGLDEMTSVAINKFVHELGWYINFPYTLLSTTTDDLKDGL